MILHNIEWAVSHSRHVCIDTSRLHQVCTGVDPLTLHLPDWRLPVVPPWRDERLVDFILLFNSINFSYWADEGPKWAVIFHDEPFDGAYGMMAALTRGLEEGLPLLDGAYMAVMETEQFRQLVRGNVQIPLAAERGSFLNAVGAHLEAAYGGRWHNVVRRAEGSAARLVKLLVDEFPSFDDVASFEGRTVSFYKRAQLAVGMIYQAFAGTSWGTFHDIDELTVYSDYKLPQVLRRLGILAYDETLADTVDSLTRIPPGSRMEVEIRAATVWAGELMLRKLRPRAPHLTAAHLDYWLWAAGHAKSPGDPPYHHTRTTAY